MPRYVILAHEWNGLHYDWLFEEGTSLLAWKTAAEPQPGVLEAEALPRHRLLYLDYEGEVSQHRGRVTQWDQGTYEGLWLPDRANQFFLKGHQLKGTLLLQPQHLPVWSLAYQPDNSPTPAP